MNLAPFFAQSSFFVYNESPVYMIFKWVGLTVIYGGLALAFFSAFKKTPKSSPDKTPTSTTPVAPAPVTSTSEANPTTEDRLRTLQHLKEAGLITAEECAARTQKILEKI